MRFRARVIPSGNATGVEIPAMVVEALGPEARPPVTIAINGHRWRSRVAAMRGMRLIGISAAQRVAAGIAEGDMIEVEIERDDAPRDVEVPADLAAALDAVPEARLRFGQLAFGLRRKHVAAIEEARSPDVRQRWIERLIAGLLKAG